MNAKNWDVPIRASWYRSNELKGIRFDRSGVVVTIAEEDTGREWVIRFKNVQALRTTTEECAAPLIEQLPKQGGFFEIEESSWLGDLGKGEVEFLDKSRHFVIGCYDEIVEVVAWEANVEPGPS